MKNLLISFCLLTVCVSGCSKSGGSDDGGTGQTIKPAITITDISQARLSSNVDFQLQVTLDKTSDKDVTAAYATVAGTAKENTDFIPASGTVTIAAGKKSAVIYVTVIGDSLRQTNLNFYVQLSNAGNASLSVSKATVTILTEDLSYLPTDSAGYTTPAGYAGYSLVWADEFNGKTVNTSDWNFETGAGGWGNNELEYYTNRIQNVFCSDGNLIIEARKESYNGSNYTSARMQTLGKREFKYGRVDIRAKLPVATGMWPALWMLGANIATVPWPGCGETDIMELIGKNPNQVVGSIHWEYTDGSTATYNNTYTLSGGDFSEEFHVFSLVWEADKIDILVDDHPYMQSTDANVTNGANPFNLPFFFIFNVAVGGDWPGPPDNTTVFPQRMFVDYIRVFQQ
ncbi:family 16 glycosylhydrolase [Parafilimonas sp.]|uniref:family 16 glycosylhydrolase n=1 Tax=Parafilimonas sp. TaxID=1969739 RepID=UPI0039E5735B